MNKMLFFTMPWVISKLDCASECRLPLARGKRNKRLCLLSARECLKIRLRDGIEGFPGYEYFDALEKHLRATPSHNRNNHCEATTPMESCEE